MSATGLVIPESLADVLEQVLADSLLIEKLRHGPARRRLCHAAGRLSMAMESQAESINRIRDTVRISQQHQNTRETSQLTNYAQPLQFAMSKLGVDKHVFEILAEDQRKDLTNAELAEKTGIDPNLLSKASSQLIVHLLFTNIVD